MKEDLAERIREALELNEYKASIEKVVIENEKTTFGVLTNAKEVNILESIINFMDLFKTEDKDTKFDIQERFNECIIKQGDEEERIIY